MGLGCARESVGPKLTTASRQLCSGRPMVRSRAVESTPDSRRSVLRFVRRVLRPVDCLEEFLRAARFLPPATIIECKLVPRAKFGSLDRPPHYRGPTIAHAGAHARVCALKCSVQGIGMRTQSRAYLAPFLPSTVSQEQPPAVEPRWAQWRESHTASLCLRRLPARRRRRSRPASCALASARTVVPVERSCLARLLVDARDVERDVN